MLQNLSERIRLCYERAAEAREHAEAISDPETKIHFFKMEESWSLLARSYELGERLDDSVRAMPAPQVAAAVEIGDPLTILNATPFLLTRCTSDLRYAFVSEACAAMLGRSSNEIVGRPIVEVIGQKAFNTILPHIQRVLLGHRVEHEAVVDYAGVGPRTMHFTYSPDEDASGNVRGWVASIIDVTEKRQAEARIASDLGAMALLRDVGEQCLVPRATVEECLYKILDAAITLAGADKGNLQLLDTTTGTLRIVAQRGFNAPFLTFFASVREDDSACGKALKASSRVIVDDVLTSEAFVEKSSQKVLLDEGVLAVTSTPLVSSEGNVVGMVSTHFGKRHFPNERELHFLDLLARQAADYLERRQAQETEKLLMREVQHRSNNLLAVIQSIAHHTFSGRVPLEAAREAFEGRLMALARANKHITSTDGTARLDDLVDLHLEPFAARIVVDGPSIVLNAKQAQDISLLLHELCTNAVKYGALSNQDGKIRIAWSLTLDGAGRALKIRWQERNGPPVAVPLRAGFGTLLLKATFRDAELNYDPDGVSCEVELPFDPLS